MLAIPKIIRVRLRPPDPNRLSLYALAKLDRWSPFVTACVLVGLLPDNINHGLEEVEAVWEIDPDDEEASLEHFERDVDYRQSIRELTIVIANNAANSGESDVSPSEIIAWAIETLTISPKDEVARIFEHRRLCGAAMDTHGTSSLIPESIIENTAQALRQREEISVLVIENAALKKKVKNTGKYFAEQKVKILAAGLHCLAKHYGDCVDANGRVVAAKLAGQVDDKRTWYGFGDEADDTQPVAKTILEHIAGALSDTRRSK